MAGKLHSSFYTNKMLVFSSFFPFLKKAALETQSSLFKFVYQFALPILLSAIGLYMDVS